MNMDDEAEAFLQEVEWVSKEVQGILSGKIDVKQSEETEQKKLQIQDFKKREKENLERQKIEAKKLGCEGKGIKFEKFSHYCRHCSREFELHTPTCPLCSRETQSSEDRKKDLFAKVEQYKKEKSIREDKKLRWENWKKTEALLYKQNSTNYKKWEFFVDETEEEPQPDFVPPENDPNFKALEQDIKERGEKRARDLKAANDLKEQGNEFYRAGKYRNAIQKYEEAQSIRKDLMVLYTNCAAAKIKIEDFDGAIKDTTRVIEYYEVFDKEVEANKETLFKAYYRRGDANRAKQLFRQAVSDYENALDLKAEKTLESLLERTRDEAENGGIVEATEEIKSSEEILAGLHSEKGINDFRVIGGYQVMFKRVYEALDFDALRVLEELMKDEEKFIQLQPLVLPLYNKRQTAAVVLAEAINKYWENQEFCGRIAKLLVISIENKHIREELAKHSASTKGKKFYKQMLEIFCRNPGFVKDVAMVLSNLCLNSFKSALDRKPNPSKMKSLIRYSWRDFKDPFKSLLRNNTTEALGLLCNICADPKIKILILSEKEILSKGVEICMNGTSSLDVERAVGFLINILVQPTDLSALDGLWDDLWAANIRLFEIDKYIPEIEERGYRLMFRIIQSKPDYIINLSTNQEIINRILEKAQSLHSESIAKVLAACTGNQSFVSALNVSRFSDILLQTVQETFKGPGSDEKLANLCLAAGRVASFSPASSLNFTKLIPDLVRLAKEKLGPVRKNIAICLGKICNNETNKEVLRNEHGIEVLNSILAHLG